MAKISFFKWLLDIVLRRKKQEPEMPYERAIIRYTESADYSGIRDDITSEIVIYEGNDEQYTFSFSKEILNSIKKIFRLPVYDARVEREEIPSYFKVDAGEMEYEVPPNVLQK